VYIYQHTPEGHYTQWCMYARVCLCECLMYARVCLCECLMCAQVFPYKHTSEGQCVQCVCSCVCGWRVYTCIHISTHLKGVTHSGACTHVCVRVGSSCAYRWKHISIHPKGDACG